MIIKIYINGLIPITRDIREKDETGGSRIYVRVRKDGMEEIEKTGNANDNGEFQFQLSEKYENADIRIHIRHPWYKGIDANFTIKDYGFFYTAKIEHDYTSWTDSPSTDPVWKTEQEYLIAQSIKDGKVREFRFKNKNSKILYYFILAISVFIGFFLPGGIGIGIAVLIIILLEWISPYSLGLKKAIRKK